MFTGLIWESWFWKLILLGIGGCLVIGILWDDLRKQPTWSEKFWSLSAFLVAVSLGSFILFVAAGRLL